MIKIKKRIPAVLAAFAIVIVIATALATVQTDPRGAGEYAPGGRNIEAYKYEHDEIYPPFPDKANFIGTLSGNWYQMGKQFGERSGEANRYVSDTWWKAECELWGKAETLKAFELYEDQIKALEPGLVDFMRGISDGASRWLDQSPYADLNHPLYATNYQRVLAVNLWDEWTMQHPGNFPDGSSTFGGSVDTPPRTCVAGCSAFAARGEATMQGEIISAHNRHSDFNPRTYEQVYIMKPQQGNTFWMLTNSPQAAANQVVNNKGVSVSLLYGGATNPNSLDYKGDSYCAEGFGVPWFHLFLYVGIYANSAKEAIEILTVGTEKYRKKTGRTTLLRGGGWIFLVADEDILAVVETTANRFAVRYAGDVLPFTGPEWSDPDYIVATNHFLCDFSYNEHNNLTDIPMTIFSDGYHYDEATGERTGLDESGVRFWTLMWDMKHNYGGIDQYRAQQIMSGIYAYDKDSGDKIEVAEDDEGDCCIYGTIRPCTQGWLSLIGGTLDAKIAILHGKNTIVFWTLGNPSDWQGAWDEYRF
jgi:hypothetical protein